MALQFVGSGRSPRIAVGGPGTSLGELAGVAECDEFWRLQHRTLTNAGALLLASVGVGIIVYRVGMRRGRSEESADYKETPAGAVPDGRAGAPPAG
jgi:hypothetical protein